jgi:predicted phage replisome organizer
MAGDVSLSEVKWIKIVTDIFDDEKILLIESMPEADAVIVIWFKLLCLAGKNNNKGVFTLNDRIPYTDEMFSTIFRRNINTVRLALKIFEQYGMIEIINNVVTIPNWGKHQTLDQIENRREYQKNYMAKKRQEQKLLAECKPNSEPNSETTVNPIEEDIEIDKKKNKKDIYITVQTLTMSKEEYDKLVSLYGKSAVDNKIEYAENYKALTKKYVDLYRTLNNWLKSDIQKEKPQKEGMSAWGTKIVK